jgi:DNA-directed RNA polymerase subunit RPC12/RpoP
MTTDNICTHCGRDTSMGSGRFVNRIRSDDGYMCAECQTPEYAVELVDGGYESDDSMTTCHICGLTSSDERRFTYGNKQDEEAITGDGSIRCGNCIDDEDREGGE